MSDPSTDPPVHPYQKFLDNHWLLLFLGVVLWTLSYTMWGWVELEQIAPAKLPSTSNCVQD